MDTLFTSFRFIFKMQANKKIFINIINKYVSGVSSINKFFFNVKGFFQIFYLLFSDIFKVQKNLGKQFHNSNIFYWHIKTQCILIIFLSYFLCIM
jgi:hypothetical protein